MNDDGTSARLIGIYDDYRTALLNKKYYGRRLESFRTTNTMAELVIAIFASGSGISGWAIWGSDSGKMIWVILAATASLLALAKPIINISKTIERYAKLHSAYSQLFLQIRNIIEDIRVTKNIDEKTYEAHKEIRNLFVELAAEDDPTPSRRLIARLEEEVNCEIPPERLWLPNNTGGTKEEQR